MKLNDCFKIISENIEDDFECYAVSYYLSYEKGKIKFTRVTTSPTGENIGFGAIDTKYYESVMLEEECDIVDFTNMVIQYANHQCEYHYDFGAGANINFKPITKSEEA